MLNIGTNQESGTKQHSTNKTMILCAGWARLTIPSFDGSTKNSTSAWVQKMDTYLQLNPMTEAKEINIATLHLDGEAHEWWHHGLVTLGHANITSYVEFTQRVMDRFERKDPEIHFSELAQLRQKGTLEAFIT
jgi:hypothetical protein